MCEGSDTQMGICMVNSGEAVVQILDNALLDVNHLLMTNDSSRLIFAATDTSVVGATLENSRLYMMDPTTLAVTPLMNGFYPALSSNSNILIYLATIGENIQLNLLNLDNVE